ncbi:hypothetical protein HHI36_017012 [Cryptolaemus montrouzieri]|uniref:Uncharacterized protein n=1 Tax=Cryptolaemus montrouzieri TaxID=559131 RepID=A0ABD2NLD0_9CUCU
MANFEIIEEFFGELDSLVTRFGIKDMPDRFLNFYATGLSYVGKTTEVVTSIGKRYIYKRSYADRGESQTLMGCVHASGSWISPKIIYKGVRWNDALKTNCLPDAEVKLSLKGWINTPKANTARVAGFGEILESPQPNLTQSTDHIQKKTDSKAKCLNEIETEHQPSTS